MLRKIIKTLIPNRGEVFFDLFIKATDCVCHASNLLVDIINEKNPDKSAKLAAELRMQRQRAVDVNKEIATQLNQQFITPIDRGDIFHLAGVLLKLTKRIIKINKKLQLHGIGADTDDCLIRSVETLQKITETLKVLMVAFKAKDEQQIKLQDQKVAELEEGVVEDLGHVLEQIKIQQYDALTVIKIKEVYKAIESAVDTSVTLCDGVMRVYVKEI
ncbi:DUF47 domain-containing protein [Fangia hongkongensis]|uniref:DUF47 domain-containing protein n=1 Tax=Fangia hongkongensis TaxID=270495 RepID=UPI0003790A2A|nr:hypothetical protein [Fangia hongkongensis]MBK2124514.1 hypothetical protein [Fangia hongkongensis]